MKLRKKQKTSNLQNFRLLVRLKYGGGEKITTNGNPWLVTGQVLIKTSAPIVQKITDITMRRNRKDLQQYSWSKNESGSKNIRMLFGKTENVWGLLLGIYWRIIWSAQNYISNLIRFFNFLHHFHIRRQPINRIDFIYW